MSLHCVCVCGGGEGKCVKSPVVESQRWLLMVCSQAAAVSVVLSQLSDRKISSLTNFYLNLEGDGSNIFSVVLKKSLHMEGIWSDLCEVN